VEDTDTIRRRLYECITMASRDRQVAPASSFKGKYVAREHFLRSMALQFQVTWMATVFFVMTFSRLTCSRGDIGDSDSE
jgi:hypothetical protein